MEYLRIWERWAADEVEEFREEWVETCQERPENGECFVRFVHFVRFMLFMRFSLQRS